jgi:hypothetical protein
MEMRIRLTIAAVMRDDIAELRLHSVSQILSPYYST